MTGAILRRLAVASLAMLVTMGLSGAMPAEAADARIGASLAAQCQSCHGVVGIGGDSAAPNIAGQKQDYLALQLIRFRQAFEAQFGDPAAYRGRATPLRTNVSMDHLAGIMSNTDIQGLAAYYAGLSCRQNRPPAATPAATPAPMSVPFCARCHGDNGISAARDIPNIVGQKESYLVLQIGAFRQSNVPGPAPFDFPKRLHPVMSEVAEHLTNAEIRALAAWYAAQNCP